MIVKDEKEININQTNTRTQTNSQRVVNVVLAVAQALIRVKFNGVSCQECCLSS